MRYFKFALIPLLFFLAAGCNSTPEEKAMEANEDKFFSDTRLGEDAKFLVEYASFLNYSLALSEMADEKAVNQEVKTLIADMREDHYQLKNELASLAGDFQITLPTEISLEEKAEIEVMDAVPQTAFDLEYLNTVISLHKAWDEQLDNVIEKTKVEQILDFARVIKDVHFRHVERVEELLESVKVNS